ncbi:MAG: tRNA (adenosine(37)-N6)-threonylcarbamoyltransferase complex ATPase subunit type 1 TsaE [Pseudohongiellaceae bacterium]
MTSNAFLPDESATVNFGRNLALATQGVETSVSAGGTATLGGRIYLSGDLGAGKTTLTRGLLRGYGHTGAVKSPTYTLVEPYETTHYNIYHFDLYRLADPEEVDFLGVFDYFDASNLCLVEWPERGKGAIPEPDVEVTLIVEGSGRRVCWEDRTAKGGAIVKRLSQLCRNP